MGRPPLPLETWGTIRRTTVAGKPTAVAYYRDSDGRTRKAQRTGRSAAAAEAALRAALRDRFAPTAEILTRESTMAELAAKWLEQVRSDRKAAATVARYESTVAKHIGAIRDVRIREAGTARLDRLVARVAEQSGPAQARMVAVVLSGMMKLAVRYDAAPTNTAAGIRAPSVDIRDVRAPTIDEIRTMREALRLYDQRPTHRSGSLRDLADLGDFLVGTAARPGEALALRWVDVDLDAATVTICGTVTRVPGEGLHRQEWTKSTSGLRTLVLPPFLHQVMIRRRRASYCEWVFPSSTGTLRWPENMRVQWRDALADTDVAWITPKFPRKAVATLLDATRGEVAAKDQLGQADVAVTRRNYIERAKMRPDVSDVLDAFAN
ncbi:tyrosine-type recombinase/integrase [Rathayibacter sp. AY1B8]|uniref:tyrosine-type recombinase/integrase n=1 Tax=Rathayibacter sp. AY1B8 TaxID=2080533 RepID=UPI000CE89F5A|nr:tyrosine-type recombinase/integrase [Rathayibacter sp. AY1B8]PPI08212.1 site-specific integrase [Rathayibacter sp. AY1B8]